MPFSGVTASKFAANSPRQQIRRTGDPQTDPIWLLADLALSQIASSTGGTGRRGV